MIISAASEYERELHAAFVVADFVARQSLIREQVQAKALELGAHAVIDDDLLEEVTGLVEWPVTLSGSFDPAFLAVPSEAVISSMKEHQKYFHLLDSSGELLPLFITVSNIASHSPASVVSGNEKVIRPRLSDAAFFFETDKKNPARTARIKIGRRYFSTAIGLRG